MATSTSYTTTPQLTTLAVPIPLAWVGGLPAKLKAGFLFGVGIEINVINCDQHG